MTRTGVLIETGEGKIKETNFGVLTAARGKAGDNEVYALLLDGDAEAAKAELSAFGVQKIIAISIASGDLATSPELQADAIVAAAKEYELKAVMGLASTTGRDLFARMAATLDLPLISDCISVDVNENSAVKSHFSGKTFATIKVEAELMLCTVRPNAIEAVKAPAEAEAISFSATVSDGAKVKIIERKKGDGGKVDLTEAPVILTGGRAIKSAENFSMLEECAALLGAAVGASRAAVDAGYAPHSMQVGQTGKTVGPKLYLACGVSGAVQHFAGMKTSKVIVGINTDKDAPIFAKSDYGIIGDIFEVIPALTEALK